MTEAEAKKRWCPFSRPHVMGAINGTNILDLDDPHPHALCIGSPCMAWRTQNGNPDTGYCGAFGRPD